MATNSSKPPPPRAEVGSFASMMEARMRAEEERGRVRPKDRMALLTSLFEEVHEVKEAITSGRNPSVSATSLAIVAMKLIESCGKLSTQAARKDSMRIVDASKEPVRDSSSRYAIVMGDRCVVWGADLEADFKISDETLLPVLPAVRLAMKTLHDRKIRVSRIVIRDREVTAWPDEGVHDPRTDAEKAPIPDTADRDD